MKYSDGGIQLDRNVNLPSTTTYWLLLDLGAYRTTVLCWPSDKDLRDISAVSDYLISQPNDRTKLTGFPSAFIKKGRKFEFVDETNRREHRETNIIESAKVSFAKEYSAHQEKLEEFKHYVTHLLASVFETIAKPEPSSKWNYKEIPIIEGIKLTVPDLFIENLRSGYCNIIYDVCKELREKANDWKLMLPDDYFKDKNNFVQISADENGAAELYFIRVVQTLPFLNLSKPQDRAKNLPDALTFFQTLPGNNSQKEKKQLVVACCVIDIGGLTTDASMTILKFVPDSDIADLKAHLLVKTSFSEPKAGEYLARVYQKTHSNSNRPWWDNKDFLADQEVSFLRIIIQQQYEAIVKLKSGTDSEGLDGIYFIFAGRPTQSLSLQDLLTRLVLETFNEKELLIMKEHCLFMSNYPHIWRQGDQRHAERFPELAKLITVIGNLFALGLNYVIDEQLVRYYIQLKTDNEHDHVFELSPDESKSLKDYRFFDDSLRAANSAKKLKLEFSKQGKGKYQPFLNVSALLKDQDGSSYPQLRIGLSSDAEAASSKRWILPSIYVENLADRKNFFKLFWEDDND
jgi:hypothetical protein